MYYANLYSSILVKNPFEFGRAVTGAELADRQAEVAEVVAALTQGGKLFLIGPRRFGKTSILASAEEVVRGSKGLVLQYDLQAFVSAEAFLTALVTDAGRALTATVEQFGKRVLKFFGNLRPEVSYNPVDGSWSASLGVNAGDQRAPLLVEAFDGLEKLARGEGKQVGVILDEFQEILTLGGPGVAGALRAAVQRHKSVGYVFAGSQTRLLTDMTGDAGRPFYRLGGRRFLGPIPRPVFAKHIAIRFRKTGFAVEDAAIEALLNIAEDVPYNAQALAHTAWEMLRSGAANGLTAAQVTQAAEVIARRDDPFYTSIWGSLTAAQKAMLLALVRLRGRTLLGAEARELHKLATPTAQAAIEGLEKKGVIRRDDVSGEVVWRLDDPVLAVWLRSALGAAAP